ncbi:hypothetical protein Zmor_018253 [Zophobas morio]|uniref:Uncharacterized protein n=1 Tax=Zophobas morio TaxID=2755281 RepID=A0AA38IDT9_9CUCU|nr:hypothetical protein Zmor_018253 [Zophobas morio]
MSELELVNMCLTLLRREIYREFVDKQSRNTDDLIDTVAIYEHLNDGDRRQSAPKCRFCLGYHYHSGYLDAQNRRRSGNANGASNGPVPNGPTERP